MADIGSKSLFAVLREFHTCNWSGGDDWERLAVAYFNNNWLMLALIAGTYVPMVFGGKYLMRNRKPFRLQKLLAAWNLFLCLFSVYGTVLSGQAIFSYILFYHPTWYQATCDGWCMAPSSFIDGKVLAVAFLFNLSKFWEVVDTYFIVLRKKPLIFLHWYHHITTMTFVWYWNQKINTINCIGGFCGAMNYGVHAVMYFYYFLRACHIYPKWDIFVTTIQTLQMVIGAAFFFTSAWCNQVDWFGFWWGFIMYASYFFLFARILVNRYLRKPAHKKKEQKEMKAEEKAKKQK